jgi:hypothetical protein|tara:strand:+ start:915 stop:1232 length:318 start_codon:yes stop_codon:yes gene_type:complete
VAFTVPLGGRPRGPKNWAIIGTKKHAIKVAKKNASSVAMVQVMLQNIVAIYVDIASPVANSMQAKLQECSQYRVMQATLRAGQIHHIIPTYLHNSPQYTNLQHFL